MEHIIYQLCIHCECVWNENWPISYGIWLLDPGLASGLLSSPLIGLSYCVFVIYRDCHFRW